MVTFLVSRFRRVPNSGRLPLLLESSLFHPERAEPEEQHGSHGKRDVEVVASA
jgi:hypothetical protein